MNQAVSEQVSNQFEKKVIYIVIIMYEMVIMINGISKKYILLPRNLAKNNNSKGIAELGYIYYFFVWNYIFFNCLEL